MALERTLSAGYMTNWAARLFAVAIERRLKARGLSPAHLPVFFALADGAARTQKDLAAAAAVEQPTMAATLARMERDGLIRRAPDPADGRSSLVFLTETALAEVDAVRRATEDVNAVALADLSPSERELFLVLLEKVVTALAADAPEKPTRAARRKTAASTEDGSP